MKKKLKKVGIGFLLLIGTILIVFLILNFNLFRSMLSVKQIGKKSLVYQEKIYGDCYFSSLIDANLTSREELTDYLIHNLGYGLLDNIDFSHGCSAFYAVTPDGDILLCNDVDHDPYKRTPVVMQGNLLGIKTITLGDLITFTKDPKDSFYNRIMMYILPHMALGGMNKDGLAVGIAAAKGTYQEHDESKGDLFDYTLTQLILSKASTVDEAVEFLRNYNINFGSYATHYMIADAQGNCVIVEWYQEMKLYYPEDGILAMSNFPIEWGSGFGKDRYDFYIDALTECKGIVTEEEAMELLKANPIKGDEFVSAVYNLTKKTARLYFAKDEQEVVYSFDF